MKNPTFHYSIRQSFLFCLASLCFGCCSAWACAAYPADNEAAQIQRIRQRLEDGSIPEPPTWTLIHMAGEKEKAEALEAFCSGTPSEKESWDLTETIRKAGGLQKYKERIAGLLHSRDATVRGFAAVWLADLGDPAYVKDILALLQAENLPDVGGSNRNWDRGQAAFALGVLAARGHAKVLVTFLRHQDAHLRAGAAAGLARMKAKECDKEIAALLSDDDRQVVCAAIVALAELDAKQYSDRIGGLLEATDVDIPATALTALVTLDAKEQSPRVVNLLKDRFKAGQAAKTLALLGAEKYTRDIAALLKAEEPLARADALVAMGILRQSLRP